MKILLKLDSPFFTNEQNRLLFTNMIEIDWDLPFIPRKDELFDFDSIVDELKHPEFYKGLTWTVDFVNYEKINNIVIPIIWMSGD
jgi:hypothetical protein